MSDSPFGAVPTGAEFLAQQTDAYKSAEDQREANKVAAEDPVAAPKVDPYADYRKQPDARYELYAPDKKGYATTIDDLLSRRGQKDENGHSFNDYRIPVVAPDGARRGIALSQVDEALSQGFKLEPEQQSRMGRYLEEMKGIKGDLWAAGMSAASELSFGTMGALEKHILTPEESAQLERLKSEHEYASWTGKAAGFIGSFATGAPVFKGAAAVGKVAEEAVARVLAARLASATGEKAATAFTKTLATKILTGAAKLGAESAVVAAPEAVTEAALGDPKDAAESLAMAMGAGAVLGGAGGAGSALYGGAKGLVERVFAGTGAKVVEKAAPKAEAAAAVAATPDAATPEVGTPKAAMADWDQKFAEAEAAKGPATKAAESAGDAYVRQVQRVKDLAPDEVDALKRVVDKGLGKPSVQTQMLDDMARDVKKVADVALRADEDVTPLIAFGERKAENAGRLLPKELAEEQLTLAKRARNMVDSAVTDLESYGDKGQSEMTVRKLRNAVENFDKRWKFLADSGVEPHEAARDLIIATDGLKREVGKASAMGATNLMRKDAERKAFALYHELLPMLEDESVLGQFGTAQKEVNAATSKKLGLARRFAGDFLDDDQSIAGNMFREFNAGKIKSYLSNVIGAEKDSTEKGLRNWISGMREQMGAVEKHHELSEAEKTSFNSARDALKNLETKLEEAKKDANALRKIKGMQEDEGRHKSNFLGLGLVWDGLSKPITTAERLHAAREYAEKLDKAGVLVTEQAQKQTADKLDEIPKAITGSGRTGRVATRAIAAVVGEHVASHSRDDQFRALRDKVTKAQANTDATNAHLAEHASSLTHGGAPNVATELTVKQQQVLAYLAREMPKSPTQVPFGPKSSDVPAQREILEYERKVEAAHDPIGTVTRHLADGTLTRTHIKTIEELYPGMLAKIRDRVQHMASDPKAPPLSAQMRGRIALLMGQSAASPADAARYQAPYQRPITGRPSGPGLDKLPDLGTDIQRVTGQ